jgi:type IV secretory pathway TrbD component
MEGDLPGGFYAPVHRALTEPILLAGAPRTQAIVNGTLIAGVALWLIGHLAAVWAARRDPAFVEVARRHLRYPPHLVA